MYLAANLIHDSDRAVAQATGRGVTANLTAAAYLFDQAHHASASGSAEALYNQAMLARHQHTGALSNRQPGTQQRVMHFLQGMQPVDIV